MNIKGLQKLTLLDYPDKIAATVFLGGCNFRCPFCHNASLVLPDRNGEQISEEELFSFLKSRFGRLSGVCVSGGEPTLYPELPRFLEKIRAIGYLVKLDTNGNNPKMLRQLIDGGMVDYVAMDIKNSRERYGETVGIEDFDTSSVEESAKILMEGRVDFEFRTTVVRQFHDEKSIDAMGRWLSGDEKFYLQGFIDSGDLIGSGLCGHDDATMNRLLEVLQRHVNNARIRGK